MTTEKQVFNLIKFKDIEIIGSFNDKNIKYPSDIDLHESVTIDSYEEIINKFIEIFINAKKNPDVYITDFKCGTLLNGNAIRWSLSDLKRGFQYIEDKKINFIETLQDKSVIKLDVIALIDNRFTEITLNYFFYFKKGSTTPIIEDVAQELYFSYLKNIQKSDYYKALKRKYRYYKINKEKQKVKIIVDIFNSDLGLIRKILSDLALINKVIDNKFRKVNKNDVIHNIKLLLNDAPDQQLKDAIEKIIQQHSLSDMSKQIELILKYWTPFINEKFKDLMKKYEL